MLHAEQLFGEVGVLLAILTDSREPVVAQLLAALSDALTEVIVDAVRYVELLVFWPAVVALGEPDLVFTQRFAVGPAGVLFVGGAVSDVAVHDDQRGAVFGVLEG